MGKFIDLTGQKFSRLTVLQRAENNKHGQVMWLCQCECGNVVVVRAHHLKDGHTSSCGCFQKEQATARVAKAHKHKMTGTRLYNIWANMKQRCLNPKDNRFNDYGGRGIMVCDEWLIADNFISWALKNGYNDNLTIERIDNNKGYSPDNCRWATNDEQAHNKRNNHLLTFQGKTQNVTQWANELKINRDSLHTRIQRGWTAERALTKKVHSS